MDQLCRLLFHISPTCRAQDEKIFSEGSRRLSVSGRKKKEHSLWPWRKSHRPFCEASLRLCCTVPGWRWEALDLSRIAQPLSGPSVHCYELRRGRLWIAEVVSAFYQNRPGFCAAFPKRSMKSVCCFNTREPWWSGANSTQLWLMPAISWLKPFKTRPENEFCTSACTCMKIEAFKWFKIGVLGELGCGETESWGGKTMGDVTSVSYKSLFSVLEEIRGLK